DVRFVDGVVAFDTRAAIVTEQSGPGGDEATGQSLDPILFFPDGATSTATLVLENKYQRRIEISLRGLTGVATVSETYMADDTSRGLQNSQKAGEESAQLRNN
ncbi:MAG: hypothetical protein ACYC6Y_27755, partial [Thermoguttaceae bacterium]